MPLADYQHQVNGLVMGPGTAFIIETFSGAGTGPKDPKRYGVGGAAGYRWGREHRRGNLVVFEGHIETPGNPGSAWQAWLALRVTWDGANYRTTPDATCGWTLKMPGAVEQSVTGRTENLDGDFAQLALGLIPFQATFECRLPLAGG